MCDIFDMLIMTGAPLNSSMALTGARNPSPDDHTPTDDSRPPPGIKRRGKPEPTTSK
jgi:hypothetical protein